MHFLNRSSIKWWEWTFLVLAGIAGAGILLHATGVYGAGVSSDSMFYISSADNFVRGRGFFDFKGDALIDFPPLYPFVLGVLNWITGITPLVWGRLLNAGALGLLIISSGLLLKSSFPERKIWMVAGTLATLIFLPLYTLAANIATDLIYILLSVWFCLAAQAYLERRSTRWLVALSGLALAATLLRWVGLAFVVSELILVFIAFWSQSRKAAFQAAIFCSMAALPVVLWIGVRNRLVAGSLGRVEWAPQKVDLLLNLRLWAAGIIAWAAPNPALYCLPVAAVLLLTVLVLNRKKDWGRWLKRLAGPAVLPLLILTAVYSFATLATGYSADHLQSYDNRYQAPLYLALLVIAFVSLDELLLAHVKARWRGLVLGVFLAIFALWGAYQASLLGQFVQVSRAQGVVEYNEYNNKQMVRSGLVVYLLKNSLPAGATLYSNEPEAVYFFLRRPVKMSPADRSQYTADPGSLRELYPRWPAEAQAYLIWFKPNMKRQYYSPEAIEEIAALDKIYKRWDGELYLARPKE